MAENFKAVREDLAKGKRLYKLYEEADQAVAVLEGYDRYEKELKGEVAARTDELESVTTKLAKAKLSVKNAEDQAEQILTDARADAAKIIAVPQKEVEAAKAKALADLAKAEANLEKVKADTDEAASEYTSVSDKLAEIKRQLEEHDKQVKAIFGSTGK